MSLSALCLECGLCCDGTLFHHVKVGKDEAESLMQLHLPTGEKRKHPVMWLPCGKLEERCCSVYPQRPAGCRRFVCGLGQRLEDAAVTLEQARAQVAQMHQRLADLRALVPPPPGQPVLRYARACIDSTSAPVSPAQLEAFRRVEELRYEVFMPAPPGNRDPHAPGSLVQRSSGS